MKKQLKSDFSLYEITQILRVSNFNQIHIDGLLADFSKKYEIINIYNHLTLFDF